MRAWNILVVIGLLITISCAPKRSNAKMAASQSIENKAAALKFIDEVLQQSHEFDPIACLDPKKGHPSVTQRCYASRREPEGMLAGLTERLSAHAQQTMGWRQDFGIWTSMYGIKADQPYGLVISMIAKGLQQELDQDKRLKAYKTYLWFSFDVDRP